MLEKILGSMKTNHLKNRIYRYSILIFIIFYVISLTTCGLKFEISGSLYSIYPEMNSSSPFVVYIFAPDGSYAVSEGLQNTSKQEWPPKIRGIYGDVILARIYLNGNAESYKSELSPWMEDEWSIVRENIIEVEINKNNITSIKDLDFVIDIDLPLLQESDSVGFVDSVDCNMDKSYVCQIRDKGITGKGVTVAVLDSGFFYDDRIEFDMSQNKTLISNYSYSKNNCHGTACAELIFDIAPDVDLYMIETGMTDFDFIEATEKLMNLGKKVDVVLCSRNFVAGSFNGMDEVCKAIGKITSNGTIWVNSAGGNAKRHWSGNFTDPDGNGFNNFSSNDESINLTAKGGENITIWLSWDGDLRDSTQKTVSGHISKGAASMTAPLDGVYQVKISRLNVVAEEETLQLFSSHDLDEHNVLNDSLGVLSCCDGVISVGAINISTETIEPYSSRGPTADGRLKPDLVAPSNFRMSCYYPYKFQGTSASASFVAGCIALALEKLGDSDCDVKEALMNNSRDLGPEGPDNIYGYGLIDLDFLK